MPGCNRRSLPQAGLAAAHAQAVHGDERFPPFTYSIGFGFGLGYFTAALHWLGAAFIQQGGIFLVLMPFGIVGLAAILAIFWVPLFFVTVSAMGQRKNVDQEDATETPKEAGQ